MIWSVVGSFLNKRRITVAVIALGVILTSIITIQSIRSAERDKITIELQEETNERRDAIREAVRPSPRGPDASDELRYLRDRQSR